MIQTVAILVAAYRELSARRLFWLALGLTLLIVALFASLGISETGVTFWGWTFQSPMFNTQTTSPETFYKLLFVYLGVDWWLGLLATILALLTTCGIIPDLVAPGSVDLLLARPISRQRLFLTKYCSGLLFAGLQVLVFTIASFVVIGLRGGSWEWGLFVAVPIVTFFYSLLFSICALVGVLTRSSVASLILTALAWAAISAVNLAESIVNMGRIGNSLEIAAVEKKISEPEDPLDEDEKAQLATRIESLRADQPTWNTAQWWLFAVKTCLPKTDDTLDVMQRVLLDSASMPKGPDGNSRGPRRVIGPRSVDRSDFEKAVKEDEDSRSAWWILGTSLGFEGVLLWLATWLFVRRDY